MSLQPSVLQAQTPAPAPQQAAPSTQPGLPPGIDLNQLFQMFHQGFDPNSPEGLEHTYQVAWSAIADRYPDVSALKNWQDWQHKYDGKLTTPAELDAALKAMVSSLGDRWTTYYAPRPANQPAAEKRISSGAWVKINPEGKAVIEYLEYGSAAYKSDLRIGDTIDSINGTSTSGMTANHIGALLSGKEGTIIQVVASSNGESGTVRLVLVEREESSAEVGFLPGNILYLRLPEFSEEAVQAFEEAAAGAASSAPVSGMILDLRGNPGGLEPMAIEVSGLFLPSGKIMTSTQRNGRTLTTQTIEAVAPQPFMLADSEEDEIAATKVLHTAPLVVLVNGSSASAAEIVTAALKDNHRATIIGTHTWGKAVAYTQQRLPNGGGLRLTVSHLLSPNGYSWQDKGIDPNQVVEQPRGATVDLQLLAGIHALTTQATTSPESK
jgi:carboxyl-terminal processing protease